mgnify:CR=1 FL=1
MSLKALLRRQNLQRIWSSVGDVGVWKTFTKTLYWVGMHLMGSGLSSLDTLTARKIAKIPSQYLTFFWREMAREDAFHITAAPASLSRTRRIAMIGDLNLAQCRKYRVEQLADLWVDEDTDYNFAHYEDVQHASQLLQGATHLMLYRTQNSPLMDMYLYEARRLKLPVLYDIDDPLFSVSAYETYENMAALPEAMKTHFVNQAPKYLSAMSMADIVTVSTPGLADHARAYIPSPVYYRRNFADAATLAAAAALLDLSSNKALGGFRVAFASGSQGHEVDFALIAADIGRFLLEDPARKLVLLGHFNVALLPAALRKQVEIHPFTDYAAYLANLASCHAAVMPLTNDIFNRCKSAVRVLDAAAVGVPVIVPDVGDFSAVVRQGKTGFVLSQDQAQNGGWYTALDQLASDRPAAQAMGADAALDLRQNWTARNTPPIIEPEVIKWVRA